jgi:hypothetical protein
METGTAIELTVTARFQFDGIHHWPDAPDPVKFLRNPHRHVFHVEGEISVSHEERETEFITLANSMKLYLIGTFPQANFPGVLDLGSSSCEKIARMLVDMFELSRCFVSEDGENGATVYRIGG